MSGYAIEKETKMNKAAFYKLSYGLYVITSREEGKFNGQIANTVFQVTSDPPTLAVSINKKNYTFECINSCRQFVVSILAETAPMTMIGRFGFKCGRELNKLASFLSHPLQSLAIFSPLL